jgi:hypothetical protein
MCVVIFRCFWHVSNFNIGRCFFLTLHRYAFQFLTQFTPFCKYD